MESQNLRLKQVREALGLKQNEIARSLSMLPSSYNQIESGRNSVSPRVVAILRLVYSVNPKWLTHGQGDMYLAKRPVSNFDSEKLQSRIEELESELERYKKIIDTLIKTV